MEDEQIILSGLWVAIMLSYFLGDIMRFFSGDFKEEAKEYGKMSQKMLFAMTLVMLLPIMMLVLSLILVYPVNPWLNVIVAIFFTLFNLMNIPSARSAYDRFLFIVGIGFDIIVAWYAWNWI